MASSENGGTSRPLPDGYDEFIRQFRANPPPGFSSDDAERVADTLADGVRSAEKDRNSEGHSDGGDKQPESEESDDSYLGSINDDDHGRGPEEKDSDEDEGPDLERKHDSRQDPGAEPEADQQDGQQEQEPGQEQKDAEADKADKTNDILDRQNMAIARVLQHFKNMIYAATNPLPENSAVEDALAQRNLMWNETNGLKHEVERLLALNREMKALWIRGPLRKPGDETGRASEAELDRKAERVHDLVQKAEAMLRQQAVALAAKSAATTTSAAATDEKDEQQQTGDEGQSGAGAGLKEGA